MAVYGIEGTPGSGKSLYAIAEFIAPFLCRTDNLGRWAPVHVYHNIEKFKPEILAGVLGLPMAYISQYVHRLGLIVNEDGTEGESLEQIRYFYKHPETGERLPDGSLIVIDEAQNYFSSRDFKERYSAELIPYISRHRHYRHTIVWITQKSEALDVTFRRQTQYMYSLHRLENWGRHNTSRVFMYEGWNSTDTPEFAKVDFSFPKKYFSCYGSFATDSEGKEYRRSYNILLHNKPLLIVAVILLCLIGYVIFSGGPLSAISNTANKRPQQQAAAHPLQGVAPEGVAAAVSSSSVTSVDDVKNDDLPCWNSYQVLGGRLLYKLSNGEIVNAATAPYEKCKITLEN